MIGKQETLEEAAEKEYPLLEITNHSSDIFVEEENLQLLGHRKSFIKGVKWQEKRMYSEEDLMDFGAFIRIEDRKEKRLFLIQDYFKVWFNQFKKK